MCPPGEHANIVMDNKMGKSGHRIIMHFEIFEIFVVNQSPLGFVILITFEITAKKNSAEPMENNHECVYLPIFNYLNT